MGEGTSRCIRACCSRCSSRVGDPVRSRTAQGTEQVGPSVPGQETSGHGGLPALGLGKEPATETFTPPVEVSSPGSAPVVGLSSWVGLRAWEWVYTRREEAGDSSGSDSEAEFMAQSVSFSGETHQSRDEHPRRRPWDADGPEVVAEEDDCSALDSGVPERQYSGLRKSEAL